MRGILHTKSPNMFSQNCTFLSFSPTLNQILFSKVPNDFKNEMVNLNRNNILF